MPPYVRFLFGILVVAVFEILFGCGEAPKNVTPPPEVTVSKPVRQQVTRYLDYTGTVSAIESVDVRARVAGFLDKINFQPRAKVKAGELLFVIDPRQYQAMVEQAQAKLEAQKASLGLAQVEQEKAKRLESKEAISELKMLEATAKRDVAKAEVDKAQADLDDAKLNLDYSQVKSPINGRVARNLVDVGNLVGANEKTLLTTVVNDESVYVYFNVSELDLLPLIRKTISEDAGPAPDEKPTPVFVGLADEQGYTHEGRLDFADTRVDASTGTIQVRAVLPNPKGLLFPGMFVRVRVPISKADAFLVPDVAVMADQGGRYVLVVDKENIVHHRRVKVGQDVERMRVIEEGLTADDRVIVNGMQRARPGSKVTPEEAAAAPAPEPPNPSQATKE